MTQGIGNRDIFSNAQFQQFVEFANTSKTDNIARATLTSEGKPHSITGTSESFFRKLFRTSDSKVANNYTRTIFKESIANMFGGENYIPDSVKEAMHMDAFDKGKPLTARRILAVKAAIDQVAEQFKTGVEANQAKYAKPYNGQANKLIETAFTACHGNADAMDIVNKSMRLILVNAAAKLLTEEAIQKKVEGLVANLNELKTLSKKNPGIYAAGKQMLIEPCKPLPPGMLTKIVQAVNSTSINDLRKLSDSSLTFPLHQTVMKMYKTVNEIMLSSGAEKKLDGADEKDAVRFFITSSLLSRCSVGTLGKIRDALNSDTAANLSTFYHKCSSDTTGLFDEEPLEIRKGTCTVGDAGATYMDILEKCLNRNLQRLKPNAPLAEIKTVDSDIITREIANDIVSLAKESNEVNVKLYIDRLVDGSGKGADTFKTILKNKLGDVNDPDGKLASRLNINAKAMMNLNICGEMKKIATGKESQFQKDIYRSGKITLTNGDDTITLSKEFNAARDELAQFVTGNKQATYNTLSLDEDKNKVHLLMAMINQETEKAGEIGTKHALHPRENEDACILGDDPSNAGTRNFSIEKTVFGTIVLNYAMEKPIVDIRPVDVHDKIPVGMGSSFNCKLQYTLSATEFTRLANLDYTKFDGSEADKIINSKQDMPDGTRQFAKNKMLVAADTIPKELVIDVSCSLNFDMKLMPSDADMFA